MTRIVIPNECEESFPSIFILCGRVQLLKHFVVSLCSRTLRPFDFAQGRLGRRFRLLWRFCI